MWNSTHYNLSTGDHLTLERLAPARIPKQMSTWLNLSKTQNTSIFPSMNSVVLHHTNTNIVWMKNSLESKRCTWIRLRGLLPDILSHEGLQGGVIWWPNLKRWHVKLSKMCKLSEDILDEKWLLSSHQLKCCYISIEQLINRDTQLGDPYNTNINYESTGCPNFVRL